jgi:hypothetical protein
VPQWGQCALLRTAGEDPAEPSAAETDGGRWRQLPKIGDDV